MLLASVATFLLRSLSDFLEVTILLIPANQNQQGLINTFSNNTFMTNGK